MIGGPGPTPNLLRQYELGKVPKEMAGEHEAAAGPHDEGRTKKTRKSSRRWWSRFLRRR